MNYRTLTRLLFPIFLFVLLVPSAYAQSEEDEPPSESTDGKLALVQAVMCEDIQGQVPQNSTTVFSIERRKAICLTTFDPVPENTTIYHHWFHRDRTSAKIKLTLKPPRWTTYSSIQFRAEDVGPWRVEITDSEGNVFQVLRFSITE
jgi:hypothetical protein